MIMLTKHERGNSSYQMSKILECFVYHAHLVVAQHSRRAGLLER